MYTVEDFKKYKDAVLLRYKLDNHLIDLSYYVGDPKNIRFVLNKSYNKLVNLVFKYYKPYLPKLTKEMLKEIFPQLADVEFEYDSSINKFTYYAIDDKGNRIKLSDEYKYFYYLISEDEID